MQQLDPKNNLIELALITWAFFGGAVFFAHIGEPKGAVIMLLLGTVSFVNLYLIAND